MTSNHRPTIVAIIPSYNRAGTIERAVESVVGQTRAPDEILVVDDGSTDDTVERLRRFEPEVRVLTIENSGAAVARNRGADATDAQWIAFLDSDDYWLPNHLERIERAIEATDGAAAVYFDDTLRPSGGRDDASLFELASLTVDPPWVLVDDATEWMMRPRQPLMLQSSVIRRDDWTRVGGLWPVLRSRHDTHVFLRLGIGHAMCAVAGAGCQMTDDDATGNRQMDAMGTTSRKYWHHTVELYGDILERHGDQVSTDDRATLARRLARGHLALARHDLRRAPLRGIASIGRAARADWRTAAGPILRRLPGGRA